MAFVKLDCGILDSTIWLDREAREIFITALLMALPTEQKEPTPQIAVRSLDLTGFTIPPGWYGFVAAAGLGIVRRAGIEEEPGLAALERLCSPEESSRSQAFDGRRLARIDGGYLILNFIRYRDRDHTAATRARRYRSRQVTEGHVESQEVTGRHAVSPSRHTVTSRNVTQAEAEAEVILTPLPPSGGSVISGRSRRPPKKLTPDDPAYWKEPPPAVQQVPRATISQAEADLRKRALRAQLEQPEKPESPY